MGHVARRRARPSLQGGLMHNLIPLIVLGIVVAAIVEAWLSVRGRG
jgi:hypothetical protein